MLLGPLEFPERLFLDLDAPLEVPHVGVRTPNLVEWDVGAALASLAKVASHIELLMHVMQSFVVELAPLAASLARKAWIGQRGLEDRIRGRDRASVGPPNRCDCGGGRQCRRGW